MKFTRVGKIILAVAVVSVAFVGYRLMGKKGGGGVGSEDITSGDQGILGRPLVVGVVTWPGYCGGIVANGGFKPNRDCIYWKGHKLLVQFKLMEDMNVRGKAFANGGVDIVWSTVDYWANELPGILKGGLKAKAIMQVDYSRGGDAIVADNSIQRVEDLQGKKISLALFTPSHWLLENAIENSSLDPTAQAQIIKHLVGKDASPDAASDFIAGKVDAAVVWEPDVTNALKKRANSHILLSSKTAANLIADVMVARDDFIQQHPDVIKAFIEGWFEGTTEANRVPSEATRVLMENEPVYKDLGEGPTQDSLATVRWADLTDNTKMFGLDGKVPYFDKLFTDAGTAWVSRGYIAQQTPAEGARYSKALQDIYNAAPVRPAPKVEDFTIKRASPEIANQAGISDKPVNIYFAANVSAVPEDAKAVLDNIALKAKEYSNAYIRVEGNTDSTGSTETNRRLSAARAQSVIDYLAQHYQLNPDRFIPRGNGPDKPRASNATPEGRQKNRRTDIIILAR